MSYRMKERKNSRNYAKHKILKKFRLDVNKFVKYQIFILKQTKLRSNLSSTFLRWIYKEQNIHDDMKENIIIRFTEYNHISLCRRTPHTNTHTHTKKHHTTKQCYCIRKFLSTDSIWLMNDEDEWSEEFDWRKTT